MTKEQYDKCVETGELQLIGFRQKLSYYGLVYCLFFMPIMVLVYQLIDILQGKYSFEVFNLMVVVIPSILGYAILRVLKNRLRFKVIQTDLKKTELREIIDGVAAKLEWSMVDSDDRFYMAITDPPLVSGSYGEQITILFDGNRVLVNSIGNPKRRSGLNFMGRNERNEDTLIEAIKAHKQQ